MEKIDREKVINGLEHCVEKLDAVVNKMHGFNCTDCPYFRKCDSSGYLIGLPLMRDAITLLKAQEEAANLITKIVELQNRPRVLTIEKVLDAEVNVDQCWLEVRGCKHIHQAIAVGLVCPKHIMMVNMQRWGLSDLQIPIDLYGSYWRMWNKKPTEEQRKEVEWDD